MIALEDRLSPANLLQSIFLPNGGTQNSVTFGNSVAVSGNLVVVGACYEDTGADNAGSAYVFNATTGALVATLNNPTPQAGDLFGFSVGISGNNVVVGARYDNTGANHAGSAYVFNAATGALVQTLNNPFPGNGDDSGFSVAVSGNNVVVGSLFDDTGAFDTGSAYVFHATTGVLINTLNNPALISSDYFGCSVAIDGDTVAVGAEAANTGANDSGAVYVLSASSGGLIRTINNPTPVLFDNFGGAVAISGNTVVIGSVRDDGGATDAGSAYVFNATTGALIHTLNNPTPANTDYFGNAVGISGNTIVVGGYSDDTGANNAGSAYLFNAATGALEDSINNPTPSEGDESGCAVGISGGTVIVGANYDDTRGDNQGAAYTYSTGGATVQSVTIGDGTAQRSRIERLNVAFGQIVTFSGQLAAAFTLQKIVGGVPAGTVSLSADAVNVGGHTEVALNFASDTTFGSLNDGRYRLIVNAAQVLLNGTPMAADQVTNFHRYFGDVNGDARIDIADFGQFSSTYQRHAGDPSFIACLDYNGDGRIDIADFGQFSVRYFTTLP